MYSYILVLALTLAGLSNLQTAVAQSARVDAAPVTEVSTRGFQWFFEHSRPEGECAGQFVVATWYDSGSRTASGQAFNPDGITAAHRTLPFGTRVTVTNPRNGKTVTVVINDRGPFTPPLLADESGDFRGNDWAKGFLRGTELRKADWAALLGDEEHGSSLVPIFALAYEEHPDPEMCSYKEPISAELREKLGGLLLDGLPLLLSSCRLANAAFLIN